MRVITKWVCSFFLRWWYVLKLSVVIETNLCEYTLNQSDLLGPQAHSPISGPPTVGPHPLHPPHSYFLTSSPSLHIKPHPSLPHSPTWPRGCRVPALGSSPPSPTGTTHHRPGNPAWRAPGWPLLPALLHRRPQPALSSPVLCLLRARRCPHPTFWKAGLGSPAWTLPTPPSPSPCAARLWLQLQIKDSVFQKKKNYIFFCRLYKGDLYDYIWH